MMPGNPIVGGTVLRIPAIQSPNFVAGVSGWQIKIDGSASFSNVTIVNGTLTVVGATTTMALELQSGTPTLSFWKNATPSVISTIALFNNTGIVTTGATYIDPTVGSERPGMLSVNNIVELGFFDSTSLNPVGPGIVLNSTSVTADMAARRDINAPYIRATSSDVEFHVDDTATSHTIIASHSAGVGGAGFAYLNNTGSNFQNVAFDAGWANNFGGYSAVQTILMPDGTVRMTGVAVYTGGAVSSGNICGVVIGHQPPFTKTYMNRFNLPSSGQSIITISTGSNVSFATTVPIATGTQVFFDDITWELF